MRDLLLHFATATQAASGSTSGGSNIPLVQLVLTVLGSTGLVGAIVTLLKLKPDKDTAAVTQAQGAAETMAILQQSLLSRLEDAEKARDEALGDVERLEGELKKCLERHTRRRTP